MNIFVLALSHSENAAMMFDTHVVKMILEYAQLLSTAHHVAGDLEHAKKLYRKTHVNHPCAVWVRESAANYMWLYALFKEVLKEYTFRYRKIHATSRLSGPLAVLPSKIPFARMTPFAQAMPEKYRRRDAVVAYRDYFRGEKNHLARYTRRERPSWL